MATGIVLGGGGTLGDFQVGALKFLYEQGILPHITCVCGTSIGAINAVIVSTGEGCDERLERYWSEDVTGSEDLIPQNTWSDTITPMLKAYILAEKHSKPLGVGRTRLLRRGLTIAALVRESKQSTLRDTIGAVDDLEDILENAAEESALYSSQKLKKRMEDKIDDIEERLDPTITFNLYATNVETGQKTCFTNNTQLVRADSDTQYVLCSERLLIPAALASAAVPPLFPPVEVCGSYYVDGAAREVVPVKEAIECGADMIYTILCLPRFANKRKYAFFDVKGEEKGEKSTDWCTSNLLDVRPEDWVTNNRNWDPTSDECDVLDITNRMVALLVDELTKDDLEIPETHSKTVEQKVIDPLIPVHGWTQLNIGLLKINADQGYMRAFDVLLAPTSIAEQCEQLTAEITFRRLKIWILEHQLIEDWSEVKNRSQSPAKHLWDGPYVRRLLHQCCTNVVDTTILKQIRQKKKELKECIDKRLAIVESSSLSYEDKKRSLPKDYRAMYLCWEPHNWRVEGQSNQPLIPTPWHRLDLGEWGSDVIEDDWPLGRPTDECTSPRSLLRGLGGDIT